MALCALLHSFMPDKVPYDQLKPGDKRRNFNAAFEAAETVGIPTTLVRDSAGERLGGDGRERLPKPSCCLFRVVIFSSVFSRMFFPSLMENWQRFPVFESKISQWYEWFIRSDSFDIYEPVYINIDLIVVTFLGVLTGVN